MRRSIKGFLILTFIAVLITGTANDIFAQSRKDLNRSRALFQEGSRAFNQKNFREAIDKYAESIVLVPKSAAAHFWKGLAHMHLGDADLALTEMTTALDQGYEKPLDIYVNRWRIYYTNKNYEAALADVNSGLELDAENGDLLLARADLSYANKDYDAALDSYQKAALKSPNSGDIYLSIARIYNLKGETKQAVDAAGLAVSKGARNPEEAYLLIGTGQKRLKNFPEAIRALESAKNINARNYDIYTELSDLYKSQNRFDDAIKNARSALTVFGNDGNIYTDLSWYYSLAKRHEEASEAAKAGIRLLPDQYMAYTNLCRAYNDLEKPEMAIRECNNALKLKPNDGETLFYLGRSHDLLKKYSDAEGYYRRAVAGLEEFVKERPDYADGYYLLGNAYFADNKRRRAIESYQKAIDLSPMFARAYYNLGHVYLVEGNKGAATEQYNILNNIDKSLADMLKAEIDKK